MGLGGWIRRTFSAAPRSETFSESPAYSLLIKGMFGQPPNGRPFLSDRAQALEIPAVLRARNLICSVSTLPLEAVDNDNRVVPTPLLTQIDPNVANVVTLAQTLEDLLFEAVAWWRITDQRSVDGRPISAVRYAPDQVSMTPPAGYKQGWLPSDLPSEADEKVIWMGGERVPISQVIRFDSPNPPLLKVIRSTFARAVALADAAEMYADNPRPADYFTPKDVFAEIPQEKIDEFLEAWKAARQARSTAWVPGAVDYQAVQQPTPADLQLAQLSKQVALDIANATGLDPEDLGISTTSRTYQNATDRRKDRINDTYSPYMAAITQRLTMADVTKRGVRVRFSLDDYLRADPKTRAEVNSIYIDKGVMSAEWVAAKLEGLPPEALPAPQPVLRPAIPAQDVSVGEPLGEVGA
jgi:hypothetical protein